MKNTKINKLIGIAFFVSFIIMTAFSNVIGILHYIGLSVLSLPWGAIIYIAVAFTLLGLSEEFFIKSGIVPQKLKYLIYLQWIFVPSVLIISIIDII